VGDFFVCEEIEPFRLYFFANSSPEEELASMNVTIKVMRVL